MVRFPSLITGLLLVALPAALKAQISSLYSFGAAQGTYTPITGGNLLAATIFDDMVTTVTVPTVFFNGTYYDTLRVSTNGFLTFGIVDPLSTNYLPISSNPAYAGCVSAFGCNLKNATTGSPEIRYEQVGNELVFQWQDVARSTGGTEAFSFQIRLNTVSGAIVFVYSGVTNLNVATTQQPQVGLRGPSNAYPANVKNRRVDASNGTWLAPVNPTAANNTLRFTSTAPAKFPAGGETYTFTPACFSPTATSTITSDCLTQTFMVNVNVTGLGTGPSANINSSTLGTLYSGVGVGSYACGPFPLANATTITVINTANTACTNSLGSIKPNTVCHTDTNGLCIQIPPTIPDYGCITGSELQSIIPISGYNTTLGSAANQCKLVSVELIIAHPFRGDLQVRLTSPSGQTRALILQEPSPSAAGANLGNPGGCPGTVIQVRDDASQPLSAMNPDANNVIGAYLPEQSLSGFTGNTNGNWVLHVCDAGVEDEGTLRYVKVRLSNVDCAGVVGGTALPGTSCNDNNPNTTNDTWGANCVCTGTGPSGVSISPKLFLEGPFDGVSLMHDSLRVKGLIPLTEPYTGLGFPVTGGGGGTTTNTVLNVTGNNAIMDWVLVELRDATTPTTIVRSQGALLQRDGDVVATDGTSAVLMSNVTNGNYYVAVRHRNHLGVMTSTALALTGSSTSVNFSNPATATYGTQAQKAVGSVNELWMGNSTIDNAIKYTGANNDRDPILVRIGGTVPTNTATGYYQEDCDMDGKVKYTGAGNDRDPILVNIGGVVPTNTRVEQLP